MTFRRDTNDGFHAVDVNSPVMDRFMGWGWLSGGDASRGDNPYELVLDGVSVLLGGRSRTVAGQTIDLSRWFTGDRAADDPRKLLVCIGPQGGVTVEAGEAEPYEPPLSDNRVEDPFDTHHPSPPDLFEYSQPPVPLHEVVVGEDALQLREEHIDDRRVPAYAILDRLEANRVEANSEFVDPAGRTTTSAIARLNEIPSDTEIRSIVAPDHFSGSHLDLTDVGANDHHGGPGTTQFSNAVQSEDAGNLAGGSGLSGQFLQSDGTAANWADAPNLEAPVIARSSDTGRSPLLFNGGSPGYEDFRIEGVTQDQFAGTIIDFFPDTDPAWAADYAFNSDVSREWDDFNSEVDLAVTLNWDTNPGAGNDLSVGWVVYDVSPTVVQGTYSDTDALAALTGQHIQPGAMTVTEAFNVPEYDDLANYPAARLQTGSEALASGANANWTQGKWVYYNNQWNGPFSPGIQNLSQLTIDVSKSMTDGSGTAHTFTNMAAPTNAADAARKTDVDAVQQSLDSHTVSSTAHETAITETGRTRALRELELHSGGVSNGNAASIAIERALPSGAALALWEFEVLLGDGRPPPEGLDTHFATFDGTGGYTLVAQDGTADRILDGDGVFGTGHSHIAPQTAGAAFADLVTYTNSTTGTQHVGIVIDNGDGQSGSGSGADRGFDVQGHAETVPASEVP